jgi:Fe-S cluster assembly protein SufD
VQLVQLPSRRVEAWKYSDLRAALSPVEDRLARLDVPEDMSPVVGLATALATGETKRDFTVGDDGTVWTSKLSADTGSVTKVVAPVASHGLLFERLNSWADQNTKNGLKLSSGWTDITVEDHATILRIVVQESSSQYEAADNIQLCAARVRLGRGSTFRQFVIAEGAKLARVETHVEVEGEGAEVELNGIYLCADGRHADLTSTVIHKAPNAKTNQLIKGVARKGGRGVFQGKIVVERAAQKTDARQHHHGMLLEDGAEIFAKPELMIHADDVACAHGNTAGGLDEKALFYLRSRGVPEREARALLTEAFLIEALPDWAPPDVRVEIEGRIGAWLRGSA